MKPKIRQKIADLNAEAEQLISIRDKLQQQLSDINTRVTQIVGAIKSLEELLIQEDNNDKTRPTDDSQPDQTS